MVRKAFIFLLMLAVIMSMVMPVYATDDVEILGTFSDKFELTSDGDKIFDIPLMGPGDAWENSIVIKNHTGEKMEVRLVEVVSKIADTKMFDILEVRVELPENKGGLYYEGLYNNIPQSEWFVMENNESVEIKISLGFPGKYGNEYQNLPFDSLWKFEARLPEGAAPENPDEPPVPTGVVRGFYISGMLCLTAFIMFIVIGKKDKKDDDKQS